MEYLKAGQKDPIHGKTVKTVALETSEFCIYIDNKNEIFFIAYDKDLIYPENFNKINSKIRRLEILVLSNLEKKEQENYNYLLANNMGEAIEDASIERAWEDLNSIETDINLIVSNNQKKYFSHGTNVALLVIIVAIFWFHLNKIWFQHILGMNTYIVIFGSLFGGIGSLIFNYSKSKKYVVNRVIGRYNNFIEGALRIFYGVIYALIVILGIKSGMILNFINNVNSLYLITFLSILAGASDTFIMGILKSIEKKSQSDDK